MLIELIRYNKSSDHSEGILLIDGVFQCYTLEDEERDVKVKHETAIPEGIYDIKLRTVGGFHERYSKRYPEIHKGMLELQDVPNFKYILIHVGNDDDNTSGCILVGNKADATKEYIGSSSDAYKALYPKVLKAIEAGEDVKIKIRSL